MLEQHRVVCHLEQGGEAQASVCHQLYAARAVLLFVTVLVIGSLTGKPSAAAPNPSNAPAVATPKPSIPAALKQDTSPPSANPSKADIRILRDFDKRIHKIWAEDDRAYSAYRNAGAEALRRVDLKAMFMAAVEWDTALAALQTKLTKVNFPEPNSAALKTALENVLLYYREAVYHERRAAQGTMSMTARQSGNPEDIRQEITKVNVATGKSVLALLKAYDELAIKPRQIKRVPRN